MSKSPTGPWTWKGKIMEPNRASSGNHPGIIDYKGSTYCYGFNYVLNFAETSTHRERRSICVDKMTFNPDGTIVKMPWWSTSGPSQIGTLDPYNKTEAETICWESGVETEKCSEGGMNVGNIENGDYIKVKGVNFGSGATSFEARVSSATNGGNIEIRLDSPTGKLIGTCAVAGTGGWQTWVTKTCAVSGATGTHDLYFKFTGASGFLFNMNWWKFNANPVPTPTYGNGGYETLGDLNGDGEVNSIDFALLRMHLLGTTPLSGKALSNADVDKDGAINSIDFALIRKYLLGIITSFS